MNFIFDSKISDFKSVALILFCLGAAFWIWFMSGATFLHDDWRNETNYLNVMKQAVMTHSIPWRSDFVIQFTDNFMTIPVVEYSPQIILLSVLSVKHFIVADLLILYAIGFIGCLKIARHLSFSIFAFSLMFILFNFNGYIQDRVAVGHRMWETIFYLPWFFYFLIRFDDKISAHLKLSFVLFLIVMQGGVHPFVWCCMFLGLTGLLRPSWFKRIVMTLAVAFALSAFQLIPSAWQFWGLKHPFLTGYPNASLMLDAFTTVQSYATQRLGGLFIPANWWEFDFFIGIFGVFALIRWGVFGGVANPNAIQRNALYAASAVMAFLSFSDSFALVNMSHIPLMDSEAVSARFIVLSFTYFLIIACENISRTKFEIETMIAMTCCLLFTGGHMFFHALLWRMKTVESFSQPTIAASANLLGQPDSAYRNIVIIGWSITAISLLIFALARLVINSYEYGFQKVIRKIDQ